MAAGLLFTLMIAWSSHEDVLMGLAVVLVAVTLAQAVDGHHRPPRGRPIPPAADGETEGQLSSRS